MSSCSAFPLSPVLYLEIYFECWFRSAQIHLAVGHLQAAGQLLAHTLLCRGPLVMGFFTLRLPRSWYHMSPQKQGSGAHRWPTATTHGEGPCAPCQEVGLKERKNPTLSWIWKREEHQSFLPLPKGAKVFLSSSPKNNSVKTVSKKLITSKTETFPPRCRLTGGHMDAWKLKYISLYEAQCLFTLKAFANLPLPAQQPWNSDP